MREKHVQKKGIVLMFISTQTSSEFRILEECSTFLPWLPCHIWLVLFLPFENSFSVSFLVSFSSPCTYQASSEFCLCLISHSVQISLVHSCGFKTFIWYLLPSFYFQLVSLLPCIFIWVGSIASGCPTKIAHAWSWISVFSPLFHHISKIKGKNYMTISAGSE